MENFIFCAVLIKSRKANFQKTDKIIGINNNLLGLIYKDSQKIISYIG